MGGGCELGRANHRLVLIWDRGVPRDAATAAVPKRTGCWATQPACWPIFQTKHVYGAVAAQVPSALDAAPALEVL
jgi:hypothetical protein